MGSINFIKYGKGWTMQEAFSDLQEEARDEYGDDIYNGKINNCSGIVDGTREYLESKLSLTDFIDKKLEDMTKFESGIGIAIKKPVVNKNKVKTKVDHIVTPGTKKWILKYKVEDKSGKDYKVRSFLTKGEAVNYAREMAEKTRGHYEIRMVKELEKDVSKVAEISYKPSKDEAQGQFVFFGAVSY
jgi:hypothetical protein